MTKNGQRPSQTFSATPPARWPPGWALSCSRSWHYPRSHRDDATAPGNGHDASVDHAAIGAFLKARIAEKGISQTVLATRMDVDPSQVSRMLSTGKGPLVLRAFETLAPEALPDADLQASIGAAPDWYLAAYAKANLPKETVSHVN